MRWLSSLFFGVLLSCTPTQKNTDKTDESAPPDAPKQAADAPGKLPGQQSFKEGMQLLCDSIDKVDANLAPAKLQLAVASWIDQNVKNPDVRELFSIIGKVPPDKRAGMMNAAAAKAGIASCAIAER